MPRILKLSAIVLLLAACARAGRKPSRPERGPDRAQAAGAVAEDRVSAEGLLPVFEDAYIKAEVDSDGDLKLTDDRFKVFIRVQKDAKRLSMFSIYAFKEDAPEKDKLRLVNRLNDKLALVRFSMPKENTLWCDYQILFDGGLQRRQLIASYRIFVRVLRGVGEYDTDDVLK